MNVKKTAILVIHGMGEQIPLETLDSFSRGLVNTLRARSPDKKLALLNRPLRADSRPDNFVRIDQHGAEPIDVYEYYWADKAERQVKLEDIIDWLIETSDGAKKFYDDNVELLKKYEAQGSKAIVQGKMVENWFLARIGGLFRLLAVIDDIIPASSWARLAALLRSVLMPLVTLVHRKVADLLVSYVGDVVTYTRADVKSSSFKARAEILDGAGRKMLAILESPENYARLLLVGHSLGSVIAYDAINLAVQRTNLDAGRADVYRKISALITFGSPLDKIAFFFRFRSEQNDYIRRQIVAQRHCFRSRDWDIRGCQCEDMNLDDPFKIKLDETIQWVNYWDPLDPVSGPLDFYEVTENVKYQMGSSWGQAHLSYWEYEPMYQDIARRFLSG